MSKWQEDWFWCCDKCGAVAPKLDIIESEFQLFEDSRATHKGCGGHVYVLKGTERNGIVSVSELKNMSDEERRIAMNHINANATGFLKSRRAEEEFRREYQNRPHCPKCGSFEFSEISTASRVMSVAMWGLASSKIGKQYQCKKCKHKW